MKRSWMVAFLTIAVAFVAVAQAQQAPQNNPQTQVPAAGGPQGDIGPIAVPKKKEEPPPEPPRKPETQPDIPQYSISVNVPLVMVPVLVTTDKGGYVPGLKKDNFRVLEDGVAQKIQDASTSEAPITAVLLIEFANTHWRFMEDALNTGYMFAQSLKPEDWIAVVSYDNRPHIMVDFTQDKRAVIGALNQLRIPGFRETNVWDALADTMERIETIEGRKYIVYVGTGVDTMSKLTYDQILKRVKASKDVTIYAVGTGRLFREAIDARYGDDGWVRMDLMTYTMADNALNSVSKSTGGRFWSPRFVGELREIFQDMSSTIRNQYVLSYRSSNTKQDGTYRKLKVELVAPDGGPLKITNEKGKEVKVKILTREGYSAKNQVE